jgi:hypothetical protein
MSQQGVHEDKHQESILRPRQGKKLSPAGNTRPWGKGGGKTAFERAGRADSAFPAAQHQLPVPHGRYSVPGVATLPLCESVLLEPQQSPRLACHSFHGQGECS